MNFSRFKQLGICLLLLLLSANTQTAWAGDGDKDNNGNGPPNRSFKFNFEPFQSRGGVDLFAACGVGSLRIGAGAKAEGSGGAGENGMCYDHGSGPGVKDVFVHDGYDPGNILYVLEQDSQNDIHHAVLIDHAQNWKMEYYIATSSGTAGKTQARDVTAGQNSGHAYPIDPKNPDITGTGSGDPKRVQFRMVIDEGDYSLDMLKDSWSQKPKITQTITGTGVTIETIIDASNSDYTDMNTPAIITHTSYIDGTAPFEFDSRVDSDPGDITGGRFKITSYVDNDDPTYIYADAPKDYGKNLDWLKYWHGSEDPSLWQPGERYGYGGGDSKGDGEDSGWK